MSLKNIFILLSFVKSNQHSLKISNTAIIKHEVGQMRVRNRNVNRAVDSFLVASNVLDILFVI